MTINNMRKWYDPGIKYSLYALPVVVPIIFHPDFYTVFSAPKLLALQILTLLVMFFWGAKVFIEGEFHCRRGGLNWVLLSYAIISIINTIFSTSFYSSLLGAQGRSLGIFMVLNLLLLPLFVWNFLKDKKEIIVLLKISFTVAAGLAIYGIVQHFGFFQESFNWNVSPGERVFGTIGHGNHFGAYLGMHALLGLFMIPTFKKHWQKAMVGAGVVLQIITILLTGSRGALASMLVAALIAAVILIIKKLQTIRAKIKKLLLPIFLIVTICIASILIFKKELNQIPIVERTNATISAIRQGAIPDRISWWLSSLEMIKAKPLFGFGLSTFRDAYNQFRRTDYKTLEDGDMQDNITPEAAHNEYLNITATQGIIGLGAFLAIIIFIFLKMDKALFTKKSLFTKKENDLFYPILGIKAALLVYLLQVIISFGVIATLSIFYIFLGAGLALAEPEIKTKHFTLKGAYKYIVVLLLLCGISAAATGSGRLAMADVYYKKALISAQKGDLSQTINDLESTISYNPLEYAYFQAFGDFALKYEKTSGLDETTAEELMNRAAASYESAIVINSFHPSAFYNLGVVYMDLYSRSGAPGYYHSATVNLDVAVQKATNNPLYPYQAARAFMAVDSEESKQKAIYLLENALSIRTPFRDAEQILLQLKGDSPTIPAAQ